MKSKKHEVSEVEFKRVLQLQQSRAQQQQKTPEQSSGEV
jgi:hypothetical protein